MFYVIIRLLAKCLFKILFRLQAFGVENIPSTGGFILASNHKSYLDPPALAVASPRALSFLAREGLFKNAVFDRFISALHAFPLDNQNGDIKALRWAIERLKAGEPVIIFPEGRRVKEDFLYPASKGVGFLAARANVPVVPAFIEGSGRAMPVGSGLIYPRKIRVYFGRALFAQELSVEEAEDYYQKFADQVMAEIKKLKERG